MNINLISSFNGMPSAFRRLLSHPAAKAAVSIAAVAGAAFYYFARQGASQLRVSTPQPTQQATEPSVSGSSNRGRILSVQSSPVKTASTSLSSNGVLSKEASFQQKLDKWVEEAKPSQRNDRQKASLKISRCKLRSDMELILLGFKIGSIPEVLSQLSSVKYLSIASCDLEDLNPRFLPPNLETLSADHNKLSCSLDFSSSRCFTTITLRFNNLTSFPVFRQNSDLFTLYLSNNPITIFPADECLPRVNFYTGPLPNSAGGRARLGASNAIDWSGPNSLKGKFIAPHAVFSGTPPSIGLGQHGTALVMGSKLPRFIKDLGANPVVINLSAPNITGQELTKQTQSAILKFRKDRSGQVSIPIALLTNIGPSTPIGRIQEYAKKSIGNVQGLVLPGGGNIEREFYDLTAQMSPDSSYTRTMTEFALVLEAHRVKKPVYGICRGAQLLNVTFGGTLKNSGQGGWQTVDVVESSRKSKIEELIEGSSMTALSAHMQCCDKIAEPLEVVMKGGEGLPKFMVSKDGLLIGSQVHLEETHEGKYSIGVRLLKFFADAVPVRARL